MAINYDVYDIPSLTGEEKDAKIHARVVSKETFTTGKLARAIQFSTSMTEGDVLSVLKSLSYHLADQLSQGNRVHIEGVGYFYITASSPLLEPGSKMRGDSVRVKSIKFQPEKTLKSQLTSVSFKRYRTIHSSKLSALEIEERLNAYLSENRYITRADFQKLCGFTKDMALNWLNRFIREGKLQKGGVYRFPVYELADKGKS